METKSRNILGVVRLNKKNRILLTRVRLSESFHCRDLSIPKEEQQAQDEYLVEDTTEIDSEEHKVDTNEKEKKELHSKLDLLLRLHENSEKKIYKPLKRKTEEKKRSETKSPKIQTSRSMFAPSSKSAEKKEKKLSFFKRAFSFSRGSNSVQKEEKKKKKLSPMKKTFSFLRKNKKTEQEEPSNVLYVSHSNPLFNSPRSSPSGDRVTSSPSSSFKNQKTETKQQDSSREDKEEESVVDMSEIDQLPEEEAEVYPVDSFLSQISSAMESSS